MLLCVTANHKTAPFDLLERLSRTPDDLAGSLSEGSRGAVVLATCNRFEAYVDVDGAADEHDVERILSTVSERSGIPADTLTASSSVHSGPRVVEHLFSVASGLESVVSGEGEIAGQVRRALTSARKHGTTSPELERLFQRASEAQRKVKNDTALGRAGRSLVRLALELADSRIADWGAARVLLVGTGAYAAVTLATLRERGAHDISVHSPSGRGAAFAAKHGIRALPKAEYARAAAHATIIITCTSAEQPVLDAAILRQGRGPALAALPTPDAAVDCPVPGHGFSAGATPSQLIVDLGMPRNVSPDVAEVPGVALLDLETIRLHAPLEELQATDAARSIVRAAAATFHEVGARESVTPAVVALRGHIFDLLEAEIERARRRGDDGGHVEQAMRHLAGVLLHTPTSRAHELAAQGRGSEFIAAVETLYGLTAAPAAQQDDAATA
ncbi:glutamyl-tRNA reductase [Microbacterium azadirachtae]|uniref:Glutamyl-tRNA reductase n=1 Tax=Microbacterium azadirachtae TaxID=582680 RepID=A0A1I6I389_9MICO|nr:glutamyl-tRNA reductase [Microbacterium azadirachtae]SFR61119.1 glutamyl-tRNA reductase [Microbacterium azadirachtae]